MTITRPVNTHHGHQQLHTRCGFGPGYSHPGTGYPGTRCFTMATPGMATYRLGNRNIWAVFREIQISEKPNFKALPCDCSNFAVEVHHLCQKLGTRGYPGTQVFHTGDPGGGNLSSRNHAPWSVGQYFIHIMQRKPICKAIIYLTHLASPYPAVRRVPGYPPEIAENAREYPGGFPPQSASTVLSFVGHEYSTGTPLNCTLHPRLGNLPIGAYK